MTQKMSKLKNLYGRLSPSAREELEKLKTDYERKILERAAFSSQRMGSEILEISVKDIFEAVKNEEGRKRVEVELEQIKRKRKISLLAFTGVTYATVGLLIYLAGNFKLDSVSNLGLIIAFIGLFTSLIAYTFNSLTFIQNKEREEKRFLKYGIREEFIILEKWQRIEQLLYSIFSDPKRKQKPSFINIINSLDNSGETTKAIATDIKSILNLRNLVVHMNIKLDQEELEDAIKKADVIISTLEHLAKRY